MTLNRLNPATASYVMRRWDLPGLRLTEAVYPPLWRMAAHVDGRARLSLLVAGAVEEVAAGGPHLSGPGSAVVKPADAVHANRFGPAGARVVSLEPDAALLEELTGECAGPGTYHWRHGAPAALGNLFTRVVHASGVRRAGAVRDLLGGFVSFVGAGRGVAHTPPPWLDAARQILHADAANPPRVQALAAAAEVHPVYFARAFRQHFHCAVSDYVRRLRVLNAAELLAAGGRPLAQIALELGFTDQAHFGHAFRRETGTTPYAYRLAHRARQVGFIQDPTPVLA